MYLLSIFFEVHELLWKLPWQNVFFMTDFGRESFLSLDPNFIIYALTGTQGFGVKDTYSPNGIPLMQPQGKSNGI